MPLPLLCLIALATNRSDYDQLSWRMIGAPAIVLTGFQRKRLNLKIDAGNLVSAVDWPKISALAKFGEADMPALAQFHACGNQHTVNIETTSPLEFEQQVHGAGVVACPAQHPSSAAQNRARNRPQQVSRLLHRYGAHLHRPGNCGCVRDRP